MDVRDALDGIVDHYVPHSRLLAAVVEVASYDPEVAAAYRVLMAGAQTLLEDHIRRGQASGFVRADIDAQRVATWLAWMLERGLVQLLAPAAADARERYVAAVTDIVWHTLYAGRET